MRSITGGPQAGRPRGPRGFARVILVLAWAALWLNTALFPCCEVAAAVLGGNADNGSLTVSAGPTLHHADAAHSEPLDPCPVSLFGDTLISGLPLVGAYEGLTRDRSPVEWYAVDAPVDTSLTAVNDPANLALAQAAPPPSLHLYLRTQRLLI